MDLLSIVKTLIASGFQISGAERPAPNSIIVNCYSRDRIGSIANSSILFSPCPTDSLREILESVSREQKSTPIIVSPQFKEIALPEISEKEFDKLLGGRVETNLVSVDNIVEMFDDLGHGIVKHGDSARADDLLEEAVKESLQFLFDGSARRFGQDRLFESLPDGVAYGPDGLSIYFDAKAYKNGFHPSSDDINRFSGYVTDYNNRYSEMIGRLHGFLVVSGSFPKGKLSMDAKAEEFYEQCQTQMLFLESSALGEIIATIRKESHLRKSINWKSVFSKRHGIKAAVDSEIDRIRKDKLII